MTDKGAGLNEVRRRYAALMAAASKSDDPRLERVFELVPREAFLPPGPWRLFRDGHYIETPDADPVHLYQNALVALDSAKGINNGEPFLHAAWIGQVAPRSGNVVCHIGAGSGYYTALLAMLIVPGGFVHAFEIEDGLAAWARENLKSYEAVSVTQGDATILPIPPSHVIYVNAGVVAPPLSWLRALRPGGRMIFPWRPAEHIGIAVMVTRRNDVLQVTPLMPAWFIPCKGASQPQDCTKVPDAGEARSVQSVWLTSERPPDETAVAIYRDIWFSSASLP